ncbi:hypothetical protein SY87_26735 [Burkholderia pseudomallei]|nr:hypothetical protein SY87_26735 [Burkholderia pseudomallei]
MPASAAVRARAASVAADAAQRVEAARRACGGNGDADAMAGAVAAAEMQAAGAARIVLGGEHRLELRCVALRCVALRCVALRCVALRIASSRVRAVPEPETETSPPLD